MNSTCPPLIILEVDFWRYEEPHRIDSPINQTGHFLEQLEAYAVGWPGEVIVMMPPGGRRGLSGVTRYVDVSPGIIWRPIRLFRKIAKQLHRIAMKAGATWLATRLYRFRLELVGETQVVKTLARVLEETPGALVLLPTATEYLCESIVRGGGRLRAASDGQLTVVLSWHAFTYKEPDATNEQFTSQLRRWSDRARPLQLQHTSAMESNAARWSSDALSVPWLPWPLDAYETGEDRDVVSAPGEPRIYLYATRPEHGSQHIVSLVEGIRREFSGGCKIRLWTGTRVAAELNANEHARRALDGVEILSKGGDLAPFQASMRGSDIAVLPYDVAPYIGRGSGALINLMVARIPVVVPAGTGLGDFVLHEGVGRTYRNRREIPTLLREMLQEAGGYDEAITRYLQKHQAAARLLVEIGGASR